jgi:hypothetical protein
MTRSVIDLVSVDKETGVAKLIIALDDSILNSNATDAIKNYLIEKINICSKYVRSGQLFDEYDGVNREKFEIEVIMQSEFSEKFESVLLSISDLLKSTEFKFSWRLFGS